MKTEPLLVLPFEDILSNPAWGLDYIRPVLLSKHIRNKIHFHYVDFSISCNNKSVSIGS